MRTPHDIIVRPVISEKADWQRDEDNVFAFEVEKSANKIQIRHAVETIWNVRVATVRTVVIRGKTTRRGAIVGRKRNWKKAYVTLHEGESIELFEGV